MRLELSKRGDYAIRGMLTLVDAGGSVVTGRHLAARTGVPVSFLPQVMGDLVRAGLVDSLQGRAGGYRLSRPAAQISVLAVVEAVEGESRRRVCVLRGGPCRLDGACRVHETFATAQDAMIASLASATLADLGRDNGS